MDQDKDGYITENEYQSYAHADAKADRTAATP